MAENVGDLKVTIRMIVENKTFQNAKKAVRDVSKSTTSLTTQMNKMGKALNGIGFSFRRLILYYGGYKGIKSMVTTINTFEQLKQQLITVEQDSTKAEMSWRKLMDFATTTPFTLDKIIAGFVRLRAVGLEPTDQQMTDLGNMASAFSMNFDDVAFAVQRAISGVSRPLKKFIPLVKIAGNQISLGFNKDEMITIERDPQKLLETIAQISRVRFGGGMERQLKTIGGQWSLVQDNASKFMYLIGTSGLSGAMVEFSKTLTEGIGEGDSLAKTLGGALGGAVRALTATLKTAQKYAWLLVGAFVALAAAKIRTGILLLNARVLQLAASNWLLAASTKGILASLTLATGAVKKFGAALAVIARRLVLVLLPLALLALGTFLFFVGLNDLVNFLQGRDSVIGDWFQNAYDDASPPIKVLMAIVSAFFTLLEIGADILLGIGGAMAWVATQAMKLSKAIGELWDEFKKLPGGEGLANLLSAPGRGSGSGNTLFSKAASAFGGTWVGKEMGAAADEWSPAGFDRSTLTRPGLVGQRIRQRVGAGRAIKARALNARNTYSGGQALTQMALGGGYLPGGPMSSAASHQGQVAMNRMVNTGQVSGPAPNVFNINVNGVQKSNEEVGKEIGKQVARDLQGRKQ